MVGEPFISEDMSTGMIDTFMDNLKRNQLLKEICEISNLFWVKKTPTERLRWILKQKKNKKLYIKFGIHENLIQDYLHKHKYLIKSWIPYSEDRRGGSGYYFEKNDDTYISGFLGNCFKKSSILIESKKAEKACANFIANEFIN